MKLEQLISLHNTLITEDPPEYQQPEPEIPDEPVDPSTITINYFCNIVDLVRVKKILAVQNAGTSTSGMESTWSQYNYPDNIPVRTVAYYDIDQDGQVDSDDFTSTKDFLLHEGSTMSVNESATKSSGHLVFSTIS